MEYWNDGTPILGELTTVSVMFRQQIPIIDYFLDMASLTLGGAGLELGAFELGWKYSSNASKNSSAYKIQRSLKDSGIGVSTKAIKSGITNGLKIAGKAVGWGGVLITGYQSWTNGNFSLGDGVKIGIGIVTTLAPWGVVYGALDFGVMVFNDGKGLTDIIGSTIDKW